MVASNAMDIMAPPLIWVEGGCYRFYESHAWPSEYPKIAKPCIQDSNPQESCDLDKESPSVDTDVIPIERHKYNQETPSVDTDIVPIERGRHKQETPSVNINVVPFAKGKYKHTFYIPKQIIPHIVGPKRDTLMRLQYDTETSIEVPRIGDNFDVVIIGSSREAVVSARRQLDLLVNKFKSFLTFTHFLSIPLTDETLMDNYKKFKNTVLNETAMNSRGVRKELFQKPEKLHLTLGILTLMNDEAIKAATRALEECNERIIKPIIEKNGPIKIKAQGLRTAISNPEKMVYVLYGKVSSENDVLQELAEKTVKFFFDKGLMAEPRDKVKLHITLMSVQFTIDKRKPGVQARQPFYPKNILMKHKDYFFGEIVLNSIRLSQRGSYDTNGYYATRSKISLVD